ncbi:MAG: hypothetical protein A2381_13495 [Bdellovibrionales bacterium RIFOXYB1_FULL_37_110]|nr:MAG: hypothetical protein A2417_08155 [Bdellovibrionales bacterium RIFOXYC1_FULL_37_79]OFZ59460.1 MAG: hypothetical protein A2381_13495 [Bdellovibrionales bacterium RIFOXYB1_FULL_37_110]OFZ64307.1 MAG: hypothetical protein A2577_02620 [Bdellovibrionales bacterium RIFOXYD1_FULL_36_51]
MARYSKGSTPKLTKELIEEISLYLKRGSYVESAAAACGVSKDTLYRWLRQGKEDEKNTLQRQLSDAVLVSLGKAEMRDLLLIDQAANGTPNKYVTDENGNIVMDDQGKPMLLEKGIRPDWKAVAWRLSRRFPERWGSESQCITENEGDQSSGIIVNFTRPSSIASE